MEACVDLYRGSRTPPQSLHWLLTRLCSQMLEPPQSLHLLLMQLCSQMLTPPQSLHLLLVWLCSQCIGPSGGYARRCCRPRSPCRCSFGGYARRCWRPRSPCTCSSHCYARTSCDPSAVLSPAASASPFPPRPPPPPALPHRQPAAPPCCHQPAPRCTHGNCPAASRARTCPDHPRLLHWHLPRSPPPPTLALRAPWCPAPGSAQAGWKGPQVHWAQHRAGVRPTDSPHTGQARARLKSAALPGAGILWHGFDRWPCIYCSWYSS